MNQYVALLRGINVGGKNLIKMADLVVCFQAQGFTNVRTYIQSGNVIFQAEERDKSRLASVIETELSRMFPYEASVVLQSDGEMRKIVALAPERFGSEPDTYRYDVIFPKEPLTTSEVMKSVQPKEGVDQAFEGNGVLYFSRLTRKAAQSHLTRIIGQPIYQQMTIRNWNTTTKLLGMMEEGRK